MYYAPPSQPAEPQVSDGGNVPWQRRGWRRYGLGGDVQAGSTMYRDRPMRTATAENNIQVPLAQALITGGFVALAIVTVCVCVGWTGNVRGLIGAGVASFAIVACVAWLKFRESHYALLWLHEEISGQDLNGDGVVGRPEQAEPRAEARNILVRRGDEGAVFRAMLDGTAVVDDNLMEFLTDGYRDGYTLAVANKHGLVRAEWDSVVDTMARLNLVTPKSQGVDACILPSITCKKIVDKMSELATS